MIPITTELNNGDIVDILTSAAVQGPSLDWLKSAKSSQARNKINQWFKKEKREENIAKGKEIIEKELKKQGFTYSELFKTDLLEPVLKKYSFNTNEDMFAGVGFGAITANKIISRLKEEYKKHVKNAELDERFNDSISSKIVKKKEKAPESGIIVKGIDNCLVRLSRCCNPVPGDQIIGYITRGRGVSVHRSDCTNVGSMIGDGRLIDVAWYKDKNKNTAYQADVTVMANDRTALLFEITDAIAKTNISMKAINARTTREQVAIMNLTLEINDAEQLEKIIRKLKKIDSVFDVERSNY